MDKKSDTRMFVAGAAPGLSSSRSTAPRPPITPADPAIPRAAPPLPVAPSGPQKPPAEAIFRPAQNEAGEVVINILPPTLYNLTHPKEEDDVSQGNRHYRNLDPVDDILRRQVERKRPGTGVFSELMIYWPDLTLEPSCPDVFVVRGLKRLPEEIENSFDVAEEGVTPCLVFEIVSATYKSTRDKDYKFNPEHYAKAGVEELVLVEPVTKGSPKIRRLTALKLAADGTSEEIKPDAAGRILLETVGFHVFVEKAAVVLANAETGERFLTSWEEEEARKTAEEARRVSEEALRVSAEALRVADLRAADEAAAHRAEAAARQEAEHRAAGESAARQEAEHRVTQAAEALAETLLTLLESRDLPLADASRQRILACHDSNELKRWLRRAWKVDTIDELWDAA